jgi:hypothetical protein
MFAAAPLAVRASRAVTSLKRTFNATAAMTAYGRILPQARPRQWAQSSRRKPTGRSRVAYTRRPKGAKSKFAKIQRRAARRSNGASGAIDGTASGVLGAKVHWRSAASAFHAALASSAATMAGAGDASLRLESAYQSTLRVTTISTASMPKMSSAPSSRALLSEASSP